MRLYCSILFLSACVITVQSYITKGKTSMDIILERMHNDYWNEEERICYEQTVLVFQNVKNYTLWASWIWNSMQPPVGIFYGSKYNLGNYDQCLNPPDIPVHPRINPQYCLVEIKITGSDEVKALDSTVPLKMKSKQNRTLDILHYGTCLPDTCKPESVSKILRAIYSVNPLTSVEPQTRVETCEAAGVKKEYRFGYYCFITLIIVLITTSIFATLFMENSNSMRYQLIKAFCIRNNYNKLVKRSDEDIGAFSLAKVVLTIIAFIAHFMLFKYAASTSNIIKLDEFVMSMDPVNLITKHSEKLIDVLLAISGCLLVRSIMKKQKSPTEFLINRYFRLIGSFAVMIFYVSSVLINTGDGPYWSKFIGREQKACSENWLISLLMLGNYINCDNICLIVSWQIPCDFQLCLMGTLLFMLWQKYKPMRKMGTILLVVLSIVIPGIETYWKKLPGTLMYYGDMNNIFDLRTNDVFVNTYTTSHHRAGPYLIGMVIGYFISVYHPREHKIVISKVHSLLLLVIYLTVSFCVLTSTVPLGASGYNRVGSAVYAALSRIIIGSISCLALAIAEYGFPTISYIGRLKIFTILNKLVYGTYISHSVVLQQLLYNRRNPQQHDSIMKEIIECQGMLLTTIFIAVLLWFFVEAPLNNIVNIIISSRRRRNEEKRNGEKENIIQTDENDAKYEFKHK